VQFARKMAAPPRIRSFEILFFIVMPFLLTGIGPLV
jgi:hypothetical protein